MAIYTREIATEFNFPNITVYKVLKDGVLSFYEVETNEGYVMYDTTANDVEMNPETMETFPVTYYHTILCAPETYNFANFSWIAVPRDTVDENYIFGVGNNDHETV